MNREYVQVKPSTEGLNPEDIVSHISSLHKLNEHKSGESIRKRLNPLEDSSKVVPEFEFLATSQGEDSPVEFFYGTSSEHLNTLQQRLTTAYPSSFDVERVEVDVLEKMIPPERYAPEDFVKQYKNGNLLFDEEAEGSPNNITNPKGEPEPDTEDNEPTEEKTKTTDGGEVASRTKQASTTSNTGVSKEKTSDDMVELDVARPSESTQPNSEREVVDDAGNTTTKQPEEIEGYDLLRELDAGLLDVVDLPDEVDGDYLADDVTGPTWTEDGEILARPTLEHGEPVAAQWQGSGERKKDWMTTMKMFSKIAQPGDEDVQDRAPLATLIQHLSGSDLPIAFQVVFKRIEDWSDQAERRKDNLHLNRDTLRQKVLYEVGEIVHKPSKERRRERRKDQMESIGESADTNAESPIAGDVGKRRKLIDNKIPKRTFRANIRAVSVANNDVPVSSVKRTMNELAAVLDHLDGFFYGLEPNIIEDGEGYRNKQKATEEFHRLVNREVVTGSGKKRPDVVLNADELCNFLIVPSSEDLTVTGVRGTRAEAKSRDPLPKPDPDLMREFHKPGMRIGYALDKEADPEPVPTQVSPGLLTKHYGRFATTGAGKSKALINDILSLYENTDGPTILVDPKGDGMAENYMKSHYERFGEESFKQDVIHFPVPDILPGFSFFNINSAVESRLDANKHRSEDEIRRDVVQNKADHYQEILKLVMGMESYGESKVAPILISSFVKILFDEEYVAERRREQERGENTSALTNRPDKNAFTHRQLEQLAREVKNGRTPQPVEQANEPIQQTIEEQIEGDEHTFSVIMNSVFNRLNYIREDQQLRKLFNNTDPNFDFRDHLDSDSVILFDLGGLRDDATMVLAGVILTELWDAIESSDQTVCTQNHTSKEECKQKAKRNGLSESNPPCREEWPDEHIVNLIVDEAASVTVSQVMTKMLEQGRSFNLSVGLSMQFPDQMKEGGDRVYKNVINNIATKLIGKISIDEEIAKAMSNEKMDVDEFNNRISALPRGEWIAQLPSPNFMETGPEPFSLTPLPIPAGHPESKHVLSEEARQRYNHFHENVVSKRTRNKYGITRQSTNSTNKQTVNTDTIRTNNNDNEGNSSTDDNTNTAAGNGKTVTDNGDSTEETNDEEYENTEMGAVNLPDEIVGGETDDEDISVENTNTESKTTTGEENTATGDTNGEETSTGVNNGNGSSSDVEVTLFDDVTDSSSVETPPHIEWIDEPGVYACKVCKSEYFSDEKNDAITCCAREVEQLKEKIPNPTAAWKGKTNGFVTSTEQYWCDVTGDVETLQTVIDDEEIGVESWNEPELNDVVITREVDLPKAIGNGDKATIGGLLSSVVSAIPPEYHAEAETIIDWFVQRLRENNSIIDDDVALDHDSIEQLIFDTPPADITVNAKELIQVMRDDVSDEVLQRWSDVGCDSVFKRFYSGRIAIGESNVARTGRYGITYGVGQETNPEVIEDSPVDVVAFALPVKDYTEKDAVREDVEVIDTPDISDEHLTEYGITRDEAGFLKAVVKAMNGELAGYNLIESMTVIKQEYNEISIDKLIDNGYLKKHIGANNRVYFTVTSDGQEACRELKQHGYETGDLGDDTPHRVGVELTREYYSQMDDVQRVELSVKENGDELDTVVTDTNGDRKAVIEVEGGTNSTDTGDDSTRGISDYNEVRRDYKAMGMTDGESVWVVRDKGMAASILQILSSGDSGEIPFEIAKEDIKALENNNMKMGKLNDLLEEIGDPGVTRLMTYKNVRDKLS